jgi:hypothetical protein
MSLQYKNKRQEIQENLSNDLFAFLSFYISNAKHIRFILSRVAKLPGQSVYMENIYLA